MACILGIGPARAAAAILAFWGSFATIGCSTDVDYLRAGNKPSGVGGGDAAQGGSGGSGGDDAGGDDGLDVGPTAEEAADAGADLDAPAEAGPDAPTRVPTGIALGLPHQTSMVMPSTGGSTYTDVCSSNEVIIGVIGTVDAPGGATYVRSLEVVCGSLTVTGKDPFQVTTVVTRILMRRGDTPGTLVQSGTCPKDQVVVGFDARVATYIEGIVFRCAPLAISGTPGAYTLTVGMSTPVAPIGSMNGSGPITVGCANGAVATGTILRAGTAIDAFALACSTADLTFSP
jgi:hypothetical protein